MRSCGCHEKCLCQCRKPRCARRWGKLGKRVLLRRWRLSLREMGKLGTVGFGLKERDRKEPTFHIELSVSQDPAREKS